MAELNDELDAVSEAKARAAMSSDDSPTELGTEFSDLFGDADFDINSIPDRDAKELSEDELARIADMQLDDILDGTDNVSIESLFGEPNNSSNKVEENAAPIETVAPIEDVTAIEDMASITDIASIGDSSPLEDVTPLEDVASIEDVTPIKDVASIEDVTPIEDVTSLEDMATVTDLLLGNADIAELESIDEDGADETAQDNTNKDEEVSAAELLGFSMGEADVLDESIPLEQEEEMSGSEPKKKAKKSKKNDKAELEDGLPKKSFGQKLKGLFFELDEDDEEENTKSEESDDKPHNILSDNEEELDENEKLLKSMYGKDIDGAPLDEETEGAEKLGFIAKLKLLFAKKKAQNAIEEQAEEEAEALDEEEKKIKKQEKKEAAAAKKEEAKAAKEAKKKEPKPEKPKKEPKPKKVKEPPKPGEILKLKPKSMIALVLFVAGAVILINLASSTFNYNMAISKAKLQFQNGNYALAYDALSGLTLEETDQPLFNQIYTIMILEKQCKSYENYTKIKDPVNALNSLIKGVAKYQKYKPQAEKLGVGVQFEASKETIVKLLEDNYGINYEKACEYVILEEKDFVQYYHTIESYAGINGGK